MLSGVLLLSLPTSKVNKVDTIELNHFKDSFTQVIFWGEDDHVIAWRMHDKTQNAVALYERKHKGYTFVWRERGKFLKAIAPNYIETWTNYDPEVLDRALKPEYLRRGLK